MSGFGFPDASSNHQEPPTGGAELQKRLSVLQDVDKKIADMLKNAQICITELSKEKQISRTKMEEASQNFRRTLSQIDVDMSNQLDYLSNVCVGTPHQGSTTSSYQNIELISETNKMLFAELKRIQEKYSEPAPEPSPLKEESFDEQF